MELKNEKKPAGIHPRILVIHDRFRRGGGYKIDKEGQHAFVNFRIQHLGYSWLYGTFKDFDGTFTFDEKNPSADKVNVTINTNSVDTNHAERDKHLRSAEFLNVAKFPQATFTSTSVKKRAMNWILPAI